MSLESVRRFARIAVMTVLPGATAHGASEPALHSLTLAGPTEPGLRLVVHGVVVDSAGHPAPGARLHVYLTDARGHYAPERPMDEPHARLSGWVNADERGRFQLETIRPGGYPQAVRIGDRDRKIPAHIHIDVSLAGRAVRKFQAVFADDPLLADPYWKEWIRRLGQPVLVVRQEGSTRSASLELALPPTKTP
jgi:protocatechuate 3,4-dioxygenase beta subunit